MSSRPGYIKQLWYKWKTLKLPWRTQFLAGADLAGNTFWEFKDALNSNRFRRIVKYSRKAHYGDVKISPQWHQWLRHTRHDAPSIPEQQQDISRQSMMKELAARADERWNSIPSFLDTPNRQQPAPAIGVKDPGGYIGQTETDDKEGVKTAMDDPETVAKASRGSVESEGRFKGRTKERDENPWQRAERGAPSENWQPQAWTPDTTQRR